jgi:hypothetical protein
MMPTGTVGKLAFEVAAIIFQLNLAVPGAVAYYPQYGKVKA